MQRRTKIVCTLGPASSSLETIRKLVEAGMNVARLNFSHGTHADHKQTIEYVRQAAQEAGRAIPILQDLQGPKIRIGQMVEGGGLLRKGRPLTLTTSSIELSTTERVYVNYPTLSQDIEVGGRILIDDGQIELAVTQVEEGIIETEVVVGGILRSRKGVNLPHIRNNTPALTEKDLRDLKFGLSMNVDLIALSFVRSRQDVADLIRLIRQSGKQVGVIAKVEKPEAVVDIDQILGEADAIMVARGDLGIEMPLDEVPITQKMIIKKCLEAAKPVITATQMLESMIDNPRPTRAEASDVANAVLDGSDAVMLSGETAAGKYPVRVVEVMDQIIRTTEAEQSPTRAKPVHFDNHATSTEQVTQAISYTAYQLATQVGASAIVCLTHSGTTARNIARHRPNIPVYAFTDDAHRVPQLELIWGTRGFYIPFQRDTDAGVQLVHQILQEAGVIQAGDCIVITAGMPLPAMGRSNMVHVSRL